MLCFYVCVVWGFFVFFFFCFFFFFFGGGGGLVGGHAYLTNFRDSKVKEHYYGWQNLQLCR